VGSRQGWAKPFYFELFGETEPLLDSSFAELATAATTGKTVAISGHQSQMSEIPDATAVSHE
jgi:hypothetical protein